MTWNVELLCTLSSSCGPSADFPSRDAYHSFVLKYLALFERYVIGLIRDRDSSCAVTISPDELSFLISNFDMLRRNCGKAMKEGDVQRRSAQHIARGVFLGGKYVAVHPLLLEYLNIRRVVQAYSGGDLQRCEVHGSLRPLEWSPCAWPVGATRHPSPEEAYARGQMYVAQLPISGEAIVKIVIPAVDEENYNLLQHFCDDVFRFMDGSLHFPRSVVSPEVGRRRRKYNALVHCSAGMHRSASLVVAFLIREAFAAGNPTDEEINRPKTVDDWCDYVKSKRGVAMPTEWAKRELSAFYARCLAAQVPPSTVRDSQDWDFKKGVNQRPFPEVESAAPSLCLREREKNLESPICSPVR